MINKKWLPVLVSSILLTACSTTTPTPEQPATEATKNEAKPAAQKPLSMNERPIVYSVEGMEKATVKKDLTYKMINETAWKLDVYHPEAMPSTAKLPAVIFVHGDGTPAFLAGAKDWGAYSSWGKLATTSGFAGVTFNYRSTESNSKLADSASDVADAIQYVRDHADELNIDRDRLALVVFSGGGPTGLTTALRDKPAYLKAIVSYYTLMDLPEPYQAYSPLQHLKSQPQPTTPMLIVKAGKDKVSLNQTIDAFVGEAEKSKLDVKLLTHPTGEHGFDILNDDDTSRDLIKQTLEFLKTQLSK